MSIYVTNSSLWNRIVRKIKVSKVAKDRKEKEKNQEGSNTTKKFPVDD